MPRDVVVELPAEAANLRTERAKLLLRFVREGVQLDVEVACLS
jgi:hypothetical protein